MQRHSTKIAVSCRACGKQFSAFRCDVLRGACKFCSRACYLRRSPEERFWALVKKTPSCWIWQGCLSPRGYGTIKVNGRQIGAHRFSWGLRFGEIPDGLEVCHDCPGGDNPACVNPDHLWLGTGKENIQDAIRKGRRGHGEKASNCRLSDLQVEEIRRRGAEPGAAKGQLAADFGITRTHLWRILSGRVR